MINGVSGVKTFQLCGRRVRVARDLCRAHEYRVVFYNNSGVIEKQKK